MQRENLNEQIEVKVNVLFQEKKLKKVVLNNKGQKQMEMHMLGSRSR